MGTQWVIRGREQELDEFGVRGAYRPRHARTRRQRHGDAAGRAPGAPSPAEQITVTRCENYGYSQVSIRQLLRDRAAIFVRARSRRYGQEQWSHQGWG
jgi:hypothetical protein